MRIYAIGDVHGYVDKLSSVHANIEDDLRDRPVDDHRVVHVGDYIDRGPSSPEVLDLLIAYLAADPRHVALIGNHDRYPVDFMQGDDSRMVRWLTYGGRETCASYGFPEAELENADRLRARLWELVSPAHLAFLAREAFHLELGDYLFVHAGIRPETPLAGQTVEDMLWIREPFLSYPDDLGHVVVHGHTPTEHPDFQQNRIGIDTGAGYDGPLTCLVLEDNDKGVLEAAR